MAMSRMDVGEVYEASTTTALDAAKGQRLSLRRAISQLEDALTEPTLGRLADWAANLSPVLDHLKEVFSVHVEVTEAPGGLYEEIIDNAPRLANKIERFRREHASIVHQLDQSMTRLRLLLPASEPTVTDDLRDALVRLFADLVRHRKRGLDLVYEAYHVDIGGES
jgi:Hemerythrin HHE cation binding domain